MSSRWKYVEKWSDIDEHEEFENVRSIHKVPFSKLRPELDSNIFSFETTDDLERMPNEIIGQHRAVRAMEFGLSVEQFGYNLFVVGPTGTERMTYTIDSINKMAQIKKTLSELEMEGPYVKERE